MIDPLPMDRRRLLRINGFGRERKREEGDGPADLAINIFDWHACDAIHENADSDSDDDAADAAKEASAARYTIYGFGVLDDGSSACIEIGDFPPYFFVRWKCDAGESDAVMHAQTVRLQRYLRDNLRGVQRANLYMRKDYWGFSDLRAVPFVQLLFRSVRAMRSASYELARGRCGSRSLPRDLQVKLYESKIDPLLRFMHIKRVQPVGWVSIPANSWVDEGVARSASTCTHYAQCSYKQVAPLDCPDRGIGPLVIASFDIECTSSHGDFPVACKDYTRLAMELETAWDYERMQDQSEYSAKKRLVAAMDYAMGLSDAEIREDGSDRLLISRLMLKNPSSRRDLMHNSVRQVVDEVYSALRTRAMHERRTSSAEDVPSVVQALAALLTRSLGCVWPVEGDPIIQIGTTLGVYGSPLGHCSTRLIYTLGTCSHRDPETDQVIVREFEREEDMLVSWLELVRAVDPDVLTGYNILGFDIAYINSRANELGIPPHRFLRFGRINSLESAFTELQLSSSALGDNVLRYFAAHGRVYIDLLKIVQRDHKLDSYKLDSVAEHFLGERKHDVSPNDIFRLQRGSADDRRVIADYCVQDCELCNRLVAKLETIANSVGMANVCTVPLSFIFMRGQGIKIFSLVAKHCRDAEFLIPDPPPQPRPEAAAEEAAGAEAAEEEEGYEGAIVLEPERGMHLESPVSVLDYNSLYPSSMISHNISHDSLVIDPRYDDLPDVEYATVAYDCYDGAKNVIGQRVCRYVTKRRDQPYEGVLPRILKELLAQRKATRKRAAECLAAGEMFRYALLDGLQLAYKVTANSLYGQMGARTSKLYLKDIAACTTSVGRSMILTAKGFVEERGARVVYGDSVAGYTPVLVRAGGRAVRLETVESVAAIHGLHGWAPMISCGKESIELQDLEIWTDAGWTAAPRLIRHVLSDRKSMVRVCTGVGVIDCTDDHSLILADRDRTPAAPYDVPIGSHLLHVDQLPLPTPPAGTAAPDPGRAVVMGMLIEPSIGVPREVLAADEEVRRAFWRGVRKQDPDRRGTVAVACKSHMMAATIYMLATSLGFYATFDPAPSADLAGICVKVHEGDLAPDGDHGAGADEPWAGARSGRDAWALRRVDWLRRGREDDPEYVYDFTTGNHRFAAGAGRLVVHNTDSIFVVFPEAAPERHEGSHRDALAASISAGQQVSREIRPLLPAPHNLEYEKTFFPFILLSKKRYVGLLYEDDPDAKPKQKSMGIALKRRDYAPIVKNVYGGVIDLILTKRDIPLAVEFLKDQLFDLVRGNYRLDDLIISKTLRSTYKFPRRIPHVVLTRRMHDRDPGSEPQVNDRVPYVFVKTSKYNALMGDRIEHIDYVRAHPDAVEIDTLLYIQSQIMKPCLQLMACALERLPGFVARPFLTGPGALEMLLVEKNGDRAKAQTRLDDLREQEVRRMIFEPFTKPLELELDKRVADDKRNQRNRANNQLEITSFLKKKDAI